MKKYIFKAVIMLMALTGAFISATAVCSADDGFVPAVRVVYEGTVKAEFSETQLNSLPAENVTYSARNHMGNSRIYKGQGPSVLGIIKAAGIDIDKVPENRVINIKAVDGYNVKITKKQLTETRYCYSDKEGQTKTIVPAIFDITKRGEGTLCIGQIAPTEQNYPAFVSYVAYTDSDGKTGEINITSETASKAPKPAIEKKTKTIEWGRQVDFSLKDFGKWDKIYYTTDGSVPDYNSEIYNYDTFSIPAVCRDLKVPEGVSSFTVKAVTAAFGKTDSDTVTYKYKVVPPAVKGIKATAGRTVKISWKKLNGADGYYIYRADKKTGSYKKIGSVKNVKTTVYKDKNARKGKTCYYKVKAYKGKNIGSFSKPAKAGIK